jgi:hypothetical protein
MDIDTAKSGLETVCAGNEQLAHLRVKKYGKSLMLMSGPEHDAQKHARFGHIAGSTWGLSFPRHTGKWEKTPFTGTLDDLLDTLVTNFPFYLEQH